MLDSNTAEATHLLLLDVFDRVQKLMELGWKIPHVYDKQYDQLLIIEAESTGIHVGFCDVAGSYWVTSDGDCVPSVPLLVRPIEETEHEQ